MNQLSAKFADFTPTKISVERFEKLKEITGLELNAAARAAIRRHLARYEYDVVLRRRGVGRDILRILNNLDQHLTCAARFASELDATPGDLWPEISGRAKALDSDAALKRLLALAEATKLILAKKKLRGNFALDSLLRRLAREYTAAGGVITVSKRDDSKIRNKRRKSKFAEFVAELLNSLPEACRAGDQAIAARWERLATRNRSAIATTWLGRPPAAAALRQQWYSAED